MATTLISVKSPTDTRTLGLAVTGSNAAANKSQLAAGISALVRSVLTGQAAPGGAADVDVQVGGTRAGNTVTVGTVVAGNTLVINSVTLTAATTVSTASQFGTNAVLGSAAAVAQDIVRAINATNAPSGILGVVRAYVDPATPTVVRLECIYPGTIGNSITVTSGGGTLTVSASPMSGGVVGSIVRPAVA